MGSRGIKDDIKVVMKQSRPRDLEREGVIDSDNFVHVANEVEIHESYIPIFGASALRK